MGQTEKYVEYDRAGRVVKGGELAVRKSRYEEDVLEQKSQGRCGARGGPRGGGGTRAVAAPSAGATAPAPRVSKPPRRQRISSAKIWRLGKLRWRDATEEAAAAEARGSSVLSSESGTCGGEGGGEDVNLNPEKLMEALRKEDKRLRGDGEGRGTRRSAGTTSRTREGGTHGGGGDGGVPHEAAEEGGSQNGGARRRHRGIRSRVTPPRRARCAEEERNPGRCPRSTV